MGVSVRLSRNSRVYLPFWIAIPFGLFYWMIVASVYLLVWTAMGLGWLAIQAGHGIGRLARSRRARKTAA